MNTGDVFPDVLRLESSAICNFNCRHCSNGQKHPTERGLLSEPVFRRLVEQFEQRNSIPRVAILYHGGEPLINNRLSDYIRWFADRETKIIKIVTNGSLLTEEKGKQLIDAGLTDIEFSFDGVSSEENDFIRCNGCFERDSENVKHFLDLISGRRLNVRITNVQILTKEQFDRWSGGEYEVSPPEYLKEAFSGYLDKIDLVSYPAMVWPGYDRSIGEFDTITRRVQSINYCSNLFETITVLSNGDIVPCCYDIVGRCVFGNIMDDNIFDIWNNENYKEFRQAVRNSTPIGICKECMLYSGEYLLLKR